MTLLVYYSLGNVFKNFILFTVLVKHFIKPFYKKHNNKQITKKKQVRKHCRKEIRKKGRWKKGKCNVLRDITWWTYVKFAYDGLIKRLSTWLCCFVCYSTLPVLVFNTLQKAICNLLEQNYWSATTRNDFHLRPYSIRGIN